MTPTLNPPKCVAYFYTSHITDLRHYNYHCCVSEIHITIVNEPKSIPYLYPILLKVVSSLKGDNDQVDCYNLRYPTKYITNSDNLSLPITNIDD